MGRSVRATRPAIRLPPHRVARRIEIDEVLEHQVGGPFDALEPTLSRHLRHGTLAVADRLDHVGPTPRRPLRRHRLDDIGDGQHISRDTLQGCPLDRLVELVDCPADFRRLGLPPCHQIGGTVTGLARAVSAVGLPLQGGAFEP